MNAKYFTLTRTAGLLAGALVVLAGARAAETDALPLFTENYIKVSATGAALNGDKAAFQARTQHSKAGAGGIEEFNATQELEKGLTFQFDGRALAGDADYLASAKITKEEFGSIEVGYKTYRTFYDNAGGFFPKNNAWLPIYRQPGYVDRGKMFVNATLELPKAPVITFKYSNETRTGTKPSTIWGDSDLTGIPIYIGTGAVNPVSANRKILPALIMLAERNETWELSARHSVANTTAVVTIAGERIRNQDWRTVDRYVGELKPFPAPTAKTPTLIDNSLTQSPNRGLDGQGFRERGISAGGRIETVISEKVTVYAGFNYHYAKIGMDGNRLIYVDAMVVGGQIVTAPALYSNGGRPAYSYISSGNLKQEIISENIGVQLKPVTNLAIDVGIKGEKSKDSGYNDGYYYANNVVLATGRNTPISLAAHQDFKNNEKPWTPAVDARYSGIPKLALYGSWEYRSVSQDERTNYGAFNVTTSGAQAGALSIANSLTYDSIKEKHGNASVGANWTPVQLVTGRVEFFIKDHENRFTGYGPSAGDFYNLNWDIAGVKLTGIVKPASNLSFTTRYVGQHGKAKANFTVPTTAIAGGVADGDTGDSKRHQISETVDWNPSKNVYAQVNASLVYDWIVTAYPYVTGTAKDVIRNAKNNYWNGSAIVGYTLSKEADVQIQGTYYKADNYDPAQAYATLPLGASAEESTLTVGIKYKLLPKTVLTAKGGYINSRNASTGGFQDFRGPIGYVAVEHAF